MLFFIKKSARDFSFVMFHLIFTDLNLSESEIANVMRLRKARFRRVNRFYLVRKTCVSYFETPSRTIPLQAEGLVPVIEIIKNVFFIFDFSEAHKFVYLRGCQFSQIG